MKRIGMLTALCVVFSCFISTIYSQGQNISADDVTYQDLKDLGASCEPKDTCFNQSIKPYDSSDRNCDCDALCTEYDTCCVDSTHRKHNANLKSGVGRQTCVNVHGHPVSFFMVSECIPKWTGNPEILKKCHEHDTRDPYTLLPALDLKKNLTYKNVFCAICNDIEPSRTDVWNMMANKILKQNYSGEVIAENFTYDEGRKSWGQWETYNGSRSFSPIHIIVTIPKERLPKSCTSGLIRDCDHTWTDRVISQKCQSYMAPIYAAKSGNSLPERYRNVHCAICNYATWSNQQDICTLRRADHPVEDRSDIISIPFPILIDANPYSGKYVGKLKSPSEDCKPDESYVFNKCRKSVCLTPGTVPIDGKCNDKR